MNKLKKLAIVFFGATLVVTSLFSCSGDETNQQQKVKN